MITDQIALPDVSDDENATINGLLGVLRRREERNLLRASYYEQKRVVDYIARATGVIPPQYYTLGIVLGWTGKAVDQLARRCNLDGFVWPEGDLADIGGSDIIDDNHLLSEIDGGLVDSLIHGPSFLINLEGEDGEPSSLIHVKDALNATGTWNRRRRRLDDLLSITARGKDNEITGLAFYVENETIVAAKVDGAWQVERTEHDWGIPADVLPYKPTYRRPFGHSRITPAIMSLQDRATKAVIRLEAHSDIYAIPDLWMLGADESIFTDTNGQRKNVWQVVMGRLKGIPDDEEATQPRADVKQFPAADPTPHLSALNAFAKMFAREAQLPDTAVAITDVSNPTSAESYDASQYELIAEAEGATRDWTPALRRAFVRGLAIRNGIPAADVPESWKSIDAKWRDPRFLSRAAQADAGMKQLAAVPWLAESEVGLELLGLNPQQIKQALSDKRRAQGALALQQIAASAQQLTGAPNANAG